MKKNKLYFRLIAVILTVMMGPILDTPLFAKNTDALKNDTIKYTTYNGTVKNAETSEPLLFATIGVLGSNIATVTNSDGDFMIKIPKNSQATTLQITHIGYVSLDIPLAELKDKKKTIRMEMATIPLTQVNIYPDNAAQLMRQVMNKVKANYPTEANMMKGFYRETIKKNRSHVGISEAVVDISKAGYTEVKDDQVKIFKGRKTEDITRMDTLVFRLKGGPAVAVLMDIIKHPYGLLSNDDFNQYVYHIETLIEIDGRPHFVVSFKQHKGGEFPLYNGKYYIETNSLAITSTEFSLNLEDPIAATNMLIQKKPMGLKINTKEVKYIVNYREQNGKWYFNYARGEMDFKLNWKRKLFNTNYAAMIEIAITDRDDTNTNRFKASERFKTTQIFSDEVSSFADDDFWGEHNTIEPDESIQSAINKLNKKGRF